MNALGRVVSDKKIFKSFISKTYLLTPWPTYATNWNGLNNFDRGPPRDHSSEFWSKSNKRFQRRCCSGELKEQRYDLTKFFLNRKSTTIFKECQNQKSKQKYVTSLFKTMCLCTNNVCRLFLLNNIIQVLVDILNFKIWHFFQINIRTIKTKILNNQHSHSKQSTQTF